MQERLREWSIKFRPIRPRAPHLKGKAERVQRTALKEFWPAVDLGNPELENRLAEWQHFYNWDRPHDSLGGRAPIDRVGDLLRETPTGKEIVADDDPKREFILPRNDWPVVRPMSR